MRILRVRWNILEDFMSRPDMERIEEEFRTFERPSSFNSKKMYDYILELEAEINQLQNTSSNSNYAKCPKCSIIAGKEVYGVYFEK